MKTKNCHAGAHPDGHEHGDRKPTETSVTGFCYKSLNLSLGELKDIKNTAFFNASPVQVAKFSENKHDSCIAPQMIPKMDRK